MDKKTKYTQRCLDIVYLMQNGWIFISGISDTNGSVYYLVTKEYQTDYFNSRVFSRLISDDLIYQSYSYPFDYILTEKAKQITFKIKQNG